MKRIELTDEQLQFLLNIVNLANIRGELAEYVVALKRVLANAKEVENKK